MKSDGKYWFGRKRFGWGFGPRSWQGWLALLIYVVLMIALPTVISPTSHHMTYGVCAVGLSVAFFAVFLWKLDTSKSNESSAAG